MFWRDISNTFQIVIFIRVGRLNNRLLATAATDGGNSITRTFLRSFSCRSLFLKFDLVFRFYANTLAPPAYLLNPSLSRITIAIRKSHLLPSRKDLPP